MSASGGPPGKLIGTGRAADVFDVGDGRVLRRNRDGASTELEAAVMQHVHAHGYPVPEVHDVDGPDLVMERIDGPTMLGAFERQPWRLRSWAITLADLHARLGSLPVPDFELPRRIGEPEVLVHGDLHPDNVMLSERGPVVIDWPNAGLGSRGSDVANTWILVATSEIDARGVAGRLQSAGRSIFLRSFLRGVDRDRARALLPSAAEHRLGDRNVRSGEADAIGSLLAAQGLGLIPSTSRSTVPKVLP